MRWIAAIGALAGCFINGALVITPVAGRDALGGCTQAGDMAFGDGGVFVEVPARYRCSISTSA